MFVPNCNMLCSNEVDGKRKINLSCSVVSLLVLWGSHCSAHLGPDSLINKPMLPLNSSAEALPSALAWVTHSRSLHYSTLITLLSLMTLMHFVGGNHARSTVLSHLRKVQSTVVLYALFSPGRRIFIIYSWRWIHIHDTTTAVQLRSR